MLRVLGQIDKGVATSVALALRLPIPKEADQPLNQSIPADANPDEYQPVQVEGALVKSTPLSMANTVKDSIVSRKIAFLVADGVDSDSIKAVKKTLEDQKAIVDLIAPRQGFVTAANSEIVPVQHSFLTMDSVMYDAVYVPGGANSVATLEADADAVHFLNQAFRHCKPIAADVSAIQVFEATYFFRKLPEKFDEKIALRDGIVINNRPKSLADLFVKAISQHRFWEREKSRKVPA